MNAKADSSSDEPQHPLLLTTNLQAPRPRSELVRRPRLVERLNAPVARKLTLVSAPAGYGKTTLVADWLSRAGHSSACLSLDAGDGDAARFAAYLLAALQTVNRHSLPGGAPQPSAGPARGHPHQPD